MKYEFYTHNQENKNKYETDKLIFRKSRNILPGWSHAHLSL